MKVEVNEERLLQFSDVFNAICIKTEDGVYGICQRDGGLEIVKEGKLVFRSIPNVHEPNIIDPSRCPQCKRYETCIIKGTCNGFETNE